MTKLISKKKKKICNNKSSSKSRESFQKGIFRVICCLEKNDLDQILVVWTKYLWAPANIWLQSSVGKDTVGVQSRNKLLHSHGWLSVPARISSGTNTTIKRTRWALSSLPAAALRRTLHFKSWSYCFVIHKYFESVYRLVKIGITLKFHRNWGTRCGERLLMGWNETRRVLRMLKS